jgi:hypothetical protein
MVGRGLLRVNKRAFWSRGGEDEGEEAEVRRTSL